MHGSLDAQYTGAAMHEFCRQPALQLASSCVPNGQTPLTADAHASAQHG